MKIWVDITYDGRSPERHKLAPSGATLGKHARATISLPGADALHGEHVKLTPRVDGCLVEQLEQQGAQISFHGRPLSRGLVPWGEELFVGDIHLRLVREESRIDKEHTSPLIVVLTIASLALVGYSEYTKRESATQITEAPPVPAMMVAVAECGHAGEAAAHRGRLMSERAHAKRMRAPFSMSDAVTSLELLAQAEACFRQAGLESEAAKAGSELTLWRSRTEEVWRVHLLRFELARRNEDAATIVDEAKNLAAMVPKKTPYAEWLAGVTRRYELVLKQNKGQSPVSGAGS